MAPEILGFVHSEGISEYSNAVDIWSLGCIHYYLSAQRVPFPERHELNNFCQKRSPFPKEPLHPRLTKMGIEFLERMLVPQPAERITAEDALNNIWIRNGSSPSSYKLKPALSGSIAGAGLNKAITLAAPSMYIGSCYNCMPL
jgi:serine/threonine protein kinase